MNSIQKTNQFELFLENSAGGFEVHQKFWNEIQDEVNKDGSKITGHVNQFVYAAEFREAVQKPSVSLLGRVMKTFMDSKVVENLLSVGKEVPWVGTIVKFGSMIYLGVQDVLENQANFRRLRDFIVGVIITIEHASEKDIEMFKKASEDVNLTEQFQDLFAEGMKLVSTFRQRKALMKFIMRENDKDEFLSIQIGLSSMLTLFNTNMIMVQKTKLYDDQEKLNEIFEKIGDGDINKGKHLIQDDKKFHEVIQIFKNKKITYNVPESEQFLDTYHKQRLTMRRKILELGDENLKDEEQRFQNGQEIFEEANKNNGRLDDIRKQQLYNAIIEEIPYSVAPSIINLSKKAEDMIQDLMTKTSLPQNLSEEIKQFWVDNFGYTHSVSWTIFSDRVESQNKVFLNSQRVKDAYNETGHHLTNYLLKQKLDIDEDNEIAGEELSALYSWCNELWKNAPIADRGQAPTTIRAILELLLKYSKKVNDDIMNKKKLDLHFKGISADWVEKHIFQNYKEKLIFIRELNVTKNPIGDVGAQSIFKNIRQSMPNLTILTMEESEIEDKLQGIENIVPQLEKLNLSNNNIGDAGVDLIVQGLWRETKKLTKHQEQLSQILIQQQQQQQLLQLLLMQSKQQLQSLGVDNTLQQLNAISSPNNNNINIETNIFLQQLKHSDKSLKILDLSGNQITDKGLKKIMWGIQTGRVKITHMFDFSENLMTANGFSIALRALKSKECVLKEVYFNGYSQYENSRSFNRFGDFCEKVQKIRDLKCFV